jgi:hypothetical protein
MMRYLVSLLLLAGPCAVPAEEDVDPDEPLPHLSIWLLRPIEEIEGEGFEWRARLTREERRLKQQGWPVRDDGEPQSFTAVRGPLEVTVHLPSGRSFRTDARMITIGQRGGIVSDVDIVRPMEVVHWQESRDLAQALLQHWDLPHERLFREFTAQGRGHAGYIEEKAVLNVQFRQAALGGNFLVVTFIVDTDTFQKLLGHPRSLTFTDQFADVPGREPMQGEVHLLRPIEETRTSHQTVLDESVRSRTWPRQLDLTTPVERWLWGADWPARQWKVHLPSGRMIEVPARHSVVRQEDEIVTAFFAHAATVRGDMPDTIAVVKERLRQWGIEPDETFRNDLERFTKVVEQPNYLLPLTTRMALPDEGLELEVELTRDHEPGWKIIIGLLHGD